MWDFGCVGNIFDEVEGGYMVGVTVGVDLGCL